MFHSSFNFVWSDNLYVISGLVLLGAIIGKCLLDWLFDR
jgi:hypothetical protein